MALLGRTFKNPLVAEGMPDTGGHIKRSDQKNPSVSLDKCGFGLCFVLF